MSNGVFPRIVTSVPANGIVHPAKQYFSIADHFPGQRRDPSAEDPKPIVPQPGYETSPTLSLDTRPERLLGMRVAVIKLDNAATEVSLKITGNVLWIPYSTNATDLIFIQPNNLCDFIPATRGWFLAGVQFNTLRYTIPTGVGGAVLYLAYTTDPGINDVRIQ